MSITDYVRGYVEFEFYREGELYYKTENGLVFPVPSTEAGTFLKRDKAILFMTYIRTYLEVIEKEKIIAG